LTFAASTTTPNPSLRNGGGPDDYRYGLGASITSAGLVTDVGPGSPAALGGLVPGMSLVAIDDRRFSASALSAAIERDAASKAPLTLLVTNHQAFASLTVRYTGGIRVPLLTRAGGRDLIADIVRPR